jgi:hypothetical protein
MIPHDVAQGFEIGVGVHRIRRMCTCFHPNCGWIRNGMILRAESLLSNQDDRDQLTISIGKAKAQLDPDDDVDDDGC